MRSEFVSQVDAELNRLACATVVNSDAPVETFASALRDLASTIATAPFDGVATVAAAIVRVADTVTSGQESPGLAEIDAVWTAWKIGATATPQPPAASAGTVTSDARVEEDVEALGMDAELAGMFLAEALDHLGTIEASVLAL